MLNKKYNENVKVTKAIKMDEAARIKTKFFGFIASKS